MIRKPVGGHSVAFAIFTSDVSSMPKDLDLSLE